MDRPRPIALLAAAVFALVLVACSDDDGGPRVVGQDGSTIDVTSTTATATPSADTSPTIVPSDGSPVPTTTETATPEETGTPGASPDPTPTSTPTATATPRPGGGTSSTGGSNDGAPFSTADVRGAMESAGIAFAVDDEREAICTDTSVTATSFTVDDSDAVWALWVYPDAEAREDDWAFEDGRIEPQTDDCELPTGFNYFNANAALVLLERGDGAEATRDAFLAMGASTD